MSERAPTRAPPTGIDTPVLTILGGTTIAVRASIVRAECCEGSHVELRRRHKADLNSTRIDVWLECKTGVGSAQALEGDWSCP